MAIGPALISAGASLLSGLLGGKKKTGIDLAALRRDALANGFNPLTVLSATGGGGYERSSGPSLSSGAYLAEAIQRGVDTYFNTPPKEDIGAKSVKLANDYIAAKKAARERQPFGPGLTETVPFVPAVRMTAQAAGGANAGNTGSAVDPVAVMVPTRGSDGITRLGPNPNGPDMDQALWAVATDTFYRATNNTFGRPLRVSDGNLTPPYPSSQYKDPLEGKVRNPWKRWWNSLSYAAPTFSQF